MSDVGGWYDRNTAIFLTVGRGRSAGAIHRELWGPGVATVEDALGHVDHLVVEQLALGSEPRLLDLGCGVGGSLCRQVAATGGSGVGLTNSAAQVELAMVRVAAAGLADRIQVELGDFADPPDLGPFDGAFAIEAYVHGSNPAAFFAAAARRVRPGARLVIVDDFLGRPPDNAAETRWIERFRRGWCLGSLGTPAQAIAAAPGFQLVDDRDLTPWIRLGRPRDQLVRLAVSTLGRVPVQHPYWQSLDGGDALQSCLAAGLVEYRMLTLEAPM